MSLLDCVEFYIRNKYKVHNRLLYDIWESADICMPKVRTYLHYNVSCRPTGREIQQMYLLSSTGTRIYLFVYLSLLRDVFLHRIDETFHFVDYRKKETPLVSFIRSEYT